MTAKEIFQKSYDDHLSIDDENNVYGWAASNIFDLTTYDDELDELFVKVIVGASKVILTRQSYGFIKDESMYVAYILVCNLFEHKKWINWGTSIRGAWFEDRADSEYIFYGCGYLEDVPFTKENLISLIEFIEEHEPKEEENEK